MLYSKAHFAVRHASSKDASRITLNGVHFKADGTTEATDGRMLLIANVTTPPEDEFPTVEGTNEVTSEPLAEFILPTDAVDRTVKSIPRGTMVRRMPILGNLALDVAATNANGSAKFFATDLDSVTITEGKKIEGEFPKTERVIPKIADDAEPAFVIDLRLMGRIVKAAKEFNGTKKLLNAEFHLGEDALSPILIRLKNPDVGTLEAVVMPMRR